MLEYIKYLLFCYGFTAIFMYGAIAEPIRNLITWGPLKKMTTCSMCLGFWVGCVFYALLFPVTLTNPFSVAALYNTAVTIFNGVISSGVTWVLCSVTQFALWGKAYYEHQFVIEKEPQKEVELHG